MHIVLKTKKQRFEERVERLSKWHDWFAWYPIIVRGPKHELHIFWLQSVARVLMASIRTNPSMVVSDKYEIVFEFRYNLKDRPVDEVLVENAILLSGTNITPGMVEAVRTGRETSNHNGWYHGYSYGREYNLFTHPNEKATEEHPHPFRVDVEYTDTYKD